MITCSIVGCTCQGSQDGHRPMKAHECGFTYYAASYWHRFCEPNGVYVSLVPGKAEEAAVRGADFEAEECKGSCSDDLCEGDCSLCVPDICTGGEFTYRVKDLFSPQELMRHRRELLAGDVVWLDR